MTSEMMEVRTVEVNVGDWAKDGHNLADNHFRLIKGPYTSPVDMQRIRDGRYVAHEEVFSPEEEVIAEPEGE